MTLGLANFSGGRSLVSDRIWDLGVESTLNSSLRRLLVLQKNFSGYRQTETVPWCARPGETKREEVCGVDLCNLELDECEHHPVNTPDEHNVYGVAKLPNCHISPFDFNAWVVLVTTLVQSERKIEVTRCEITSDSPLLIRQLQATNSCDIVSQLDNPAPDTLETCRDLEELCNDSN